MKTMSATVASRPDPGPDREVLVSPQWLEAHLGDPRVRVAEVDVSAALTAQDNLAEAINVYGHLTQCLRDQLGVSPSPATRALYERLLAAT
jgi:DNA-binding SARP family transcriptional activator